MLALDQTRVKRLTAIHGWSAVALGWLLYAVLLTGSVAVFDDEIGAWSSGGAAEGAALAQPLDATLRRLAARTDPAFLEEIGISHTARGEPRFFFHEHRTDENGQLQDYGVRFIVDPETGAVIDQAEGYAREISRNERSDALADFIVDLHVQLYTPEPWGLILTGILGLAMMVAVVSGILMHRHVIRDMFVAERPGDRLVSARDRHVLAGTWGIPFAFLLAFTGSFFSFAISVGLPMVALVAFGGDQERIIGALVATEVEPDATPSTLASIDYLAYDATQIAGGEPPDFILIERYGRADARVSTFHEPSGGDMVGMRLAFDGPTREFLGEMPSFGTKPSAGSAVISVMGPLHFGVAEAVPGRAIGAAHTIFDAIPPKSP
ncbi:MAG: PepSY-associated TM helix domain-containing protein, partial [Pseudomonadota bacterium]